MSERLPPPTPELKKYARLLGPQRLLRLIEARGGTRLTVPLTTRRSSLGEELGDDLAAALVEHWGGIILKVPLGRAWRVQIYHGRGDSYATIALRVGLTEDGVWRILRLSGLTGETAPGAPAGASSARPNPTQLDLVDWIATRDRGREADPGPRG